jgi:hypothetical protein
MIELEYFDWMYRLVCNDKYSKKTTYSNLLHLLHEVKFTYILPMDANRAEDGADLRYRFGYENGYSTSTIASYLDNGDSSVLEMMIALAMRCEDHIMEDSDVGNRIGQWFWNMIVTLGLGYMNDDHFDQDYALDRIYAFLNREYGPNGDGGLFRVENPRCDMRDVDIWYQMCWYLQEVIEG